MKVKSCAQQQFPGCRLNRGGSLVLAHWHDDRVAPELYFSMKTISNARVCQNLPDMLITDVENAADLGSEVARFGKSAYFLRFGFQAVDDLVEGDVEEVMDSPS